MSVRIRSGSASDVGRVRTKNEDLAFESGGLFAVADGMGGHVGGEVAARVAVEALADTFAAKPTEEGLLDAVVAANAAVWSESQEHRDLRGMGTTLTAAAAVSSEDGEDVIALANVGDSRAYVVAEGNLVQVTADHSLAEERVRQGVMSEAEAAVHPHRHILTRALGIGPGVDVDLWELRLRPGDRLLLCSDGLTNEVADERIAELLSAHPDPVEAAGVLVDEANQHGGNDNITVVVVDVLQGEGDLPPEAGRGPVIAMPLGQLASDGAPSGASTTNGQSGPNDPVGGPALVDGTLVHDATGMVPMVAAGGTVLPEATPGQEAGAPITSLGSSGMRSGGPTAVVTRPPRKVDDLAEEERRASKRSQPRRITIRVALFVLLLAGVVIAGYFLVRWYAMDSYFVTVDHNELVVYQGRPGGLLGFQPKVVDHTGVTTQEILPIRLPAVRSDVTEPTLRAAEAYVRNLHNEAIAQSLNEQGNNKASPGVTTTTTTAPPPGAPTTTAPGTPPAPGAPPTTAPPAPATPVLP